MRDLGRMPYDEALALQHALVAQRQADAIPDTLLLVEHPAVITLGRRRDSQSHVLAAGDTPVVQVERGGDVTWHGPGQLVGYPIFLLREHERDAHGPLRALEDAFIALLSTYGIAAQRKPGHTGVWATSRVATTPQKLVSLGLAIHGWVTFHGFALNVDCDLGEFARIQPCGMEARVMGSLASLGATIPAPATLHREVAGAIAAAFGRALVA